MYFFDTGLVSYLTKYSGPGIIMNRAINGAIPDNYLITEIFKTWTNTAKAGIFHYYRNDLT